MNRPPPTLADIAREAGVSLMTVSRVVNHKEGVGPEQRQRIEAIIERLGYRPSAAARSLVTRRTGSIGLVVPDITNPFFPDVALGAEQACFEHGYNLLLCNTEEDTQREQEVLDLLAEKRVDGVILCSSRLDVRDLEAALAPHPAAVLVNHPLDDLSASIPLAGAVLIDDLAGGRMAALHLKMRGHHEIGVLAGPSASVSGRARLAGACDAMEKQLLSSTCAPTVDGGRQAALQLLQAHPALTALICFNDLTAVGALQAATELGRRVPEELAVVGYDDIYLAALATPPLTTLRVARATLGRHATQLLLRFLSEQPQRPPQTVVLSPELIIRQSAP